MKEFQTFLVKADEALSRGLKLCIIARGLPGKEKTTIITDIKKYFSKKGKQTVISASDDYMLDLSGKHSFSTEMLPLVRKACSEKLVTAMQCGADIVLQHDTNIVSLESEDLRIEAEKLGYLVVYLQSKEAWSTLGTLQPHLEKMCEISKSEEQNGGPIKLCLIDNYIENITPRYIAYWMKINTFIKDLDTASVDEQQFYTAITNLVAEVVGVKDCNVDKEIKAEVEDKYNMFKSSLPLMDLTDSDADSDKVDDKSHIILDDNEEQTLNSMLHVTMDYIGDSDFLNNGDLCIQEDILSSCDMYITALYADERGVGALISFNNENYYTSITSSEHENEIYTSSDQKTDIIESKEEESTTKEISSGVNEVIIGKDNSIFLKYTAHLKVKREEQGFKQSVPHITLVTNIKREAYEIGEAAAEFKNILISKEFQTELRTLPLIKTEGESNNNFSIVSVGKFRAVLFDKPVKIVGTYACVYGKKLSEPVIEEYWDLTEDIKAENCDVNGAGDSMIVEATAAGTDTSSVATISEESLGSIDASAVLAAATEDTGNDLVVAIGSDVVNIETPAADLQSCIEGSSIVSTPIITEDGNSIVSVDPITSVEANVNTYHSSEDLFSNSLVVVNGAIGDNADGGNNDNSSSSKRYNNNKKGMSGKYRSEGESYDEPTDDNNNDNNNNRGNHYGNNRNNDNYGNRNNNSNNNNNNSRNNNRNSNNNNYNDNRNQNNNRNNRNNNNDKSNSSSSNNQSNESSQEFLQIIALLPPVLRHINPKFLELLVKDQANVAFILDDNGEVDQNRLEILRSRLMGGGEHNSNNNNNRNNYGNNRNNNNSHYNNNQNNNNHNNNNHHHNNSNNNDNYNNSNNRNRGPVTGGGPPQYQPPPQTTPQYPPQFVPPPQFNGVAPQSFTYTETMTRTMMQGSQPGNEQNNNLNIANQGYDRNQGRGGYNQDPNNGNNYNDMGNNFSQDDDEAARKRIRFNESSEAFPPLLTQGQRDNGPMGPGQGGQDPYREQGGYIGEDQQRYEQMDSNGMGNRDNSNSNQRRNDAQNKFPTTKSAVSCRFFNTSKGCQFGDKCPFGHFLEEVGAMAVSTSSASGSGPSGVRGQGANNNNNNRSNNNNNSNKKEFSKYGPQGGSGDKRQKTARR